MSAPKNILCIFFSTRAHFEAFNIELIAKKFKLLSIYILKVSNQLFV